MQYSHLDMLESKSIHILRESYSAFRNLCMLWSIGKDSTVLLCPLSAGPRRHAL